MNSNTYYIFRHGSTFATRDKVPYGDKVLTAEILPEGEPAIRKLGEHLKKVKHDYFYSSEILRCVQTSKIVSEVSGKKFQTDRLLNEMLEPTFRDFKIRMEGLVQKLERARGTTYIICTHGAVISALKYLLAYKSYTEDKLMDFPEPGTLMIVKFSGSEILDFNVSQGKALKA